MALIYSPWLQALDSNGDPFSGAKLSVFDAGTTDLQQNGSASYYVTSQANKIYATNRTNQIGSIGTRLVVKDVSEAMEKAGIKNVVIDTGKNKTIGEGNKVTQAQEEYLQGIVDQLEGFFEQTVQRGRPGIDINAVNDGSIFLAQVAKEKGLIDGIDSMEGTRARLEAMTR